VTEGKEEIQKKSARNPKKTRKNTGKQKEIRLALGRKADGKDGCCFEYRLGYWFWLDFWIWRIR